jgi:hypothetical protein
MNSTAAYKEAPARIAANLLFQNIFILFVLLEMTQKRSKLNIKPKTLKEN